METSLHRDLKRLYGGNDVQFEAALGAIASTWWPTAAWSRSNSARWRPFATRCSILLKHHRVLVVKPIIVQKTLIRRADTGGPVTHQRKSPKHGSLLDLFDELIHFARVFPHPRLTLDVPLIDVEEWRYPGHGRRRRWRQDDFQVEDQHLIAVHETQRSRRPTIWPGSSGVLCRCSFIPATWPKGCGYRDGRRSGSPIVCGRAALYVKWASRGTPGSTGS